MKKPKTKKSKTKIFINPFKFYSVNNLLQVTLYMLAKQFNVQSLSLTITFSLIKMDFIKKFKIGFLIATTIIAGTYHLYSDNDYMLNFLASIYKVTYNKLFIL